MAVLAGKEAKVEETDGVVAVDIDTSKACAGLVILARQRAEIEETNRTILIDIWCEIDACTIVPDAFWRTRVVSGDDDSVDDDTARIADELDGVVAARERVVDDSSGGGNTDPVGGCVRKVCRCAARIGRDGTSANGIASRTIDVEQVVAVS